jgi:threonine dehydratase
MSESRESLALVTLEEVEAAARRIAPWLSPTPLVSMNAPDVRLKAENLLPVGAFKLRGALNAILALPEAVRRRGVVAHSSGNHAQAVAYAGHQLGLRAVVVMPDNAPAAKLAATRRWGAEVIVVGPASRERAAVAQRLADQQGLTLIPPYDAREIIAGTGTIGLEILRQWPAVETVVVPVSGGGLLSGVATAIKLSRPAVRVIGAEPELADDAARSFRAGELLSLPAETVVRTAADGLRVQQLGELPWAHIRAYVDDIVTITEIDMREAVRRIARECRLVAEPSGAVAPGVALALAEAKPQRVVAILSGGNVDLPAYAALLGEAVG